MYVKLLPYYLKFTAHVSNAIKQGKTPQNMLEFHLANY